MGDERTLKAFEPKSVRSPNLMHRAILFTSNDVHSVFVGSFL